MKHLGVLGGSALTINLTISSPSGQGTGKTTAALSISASTAIGTIYWVVSTSAVAPNSAQIIAGKDSTGALAAASGAIGGVILGTNTASATGLVEATTYYAYFAQSGGGAQSNVVGSAAFSTQNISSIVGTVPSRINILPSGSNFTPDAIYPAQGTLWTSNNSSVQSAGVLSPDGTLSGQHLTEDNSNGKHSLYGPNAFGLGGNYANLPMRLAVVAKAKERTRFVLRQYSFNDSTNIAVGFDLAGGQTNYSNVLGANWVLSGAAITSLPNGWQLCTVDAYQTDASVSPGISVEIILDNGSGSAANSTSYAGDGTSGVLVWYASLLPLGAWDITRTLFSDDFDSLSTIDVNDTRAAGFNWYTHNQWPTTPDTVFARNTNVFVVFSGQVGYTVAAGFVVSDGTHQYVTQQDATIAAGGSTPQTLCSAIGNGRWSVPLSTVTTLVTVPPVLTPPLTVTNTLVGYPGCTATPPANISITNSILTLAGDVSVWGCTIMTAASDPNDSTQFVGQAFSYPNVMEAKMTFDPTLAGLIVHAPLTQWIGFSNQPGFIDHPAPTTVTWWMVSVESLVYPNPVLPSPAVALETDILEVGAPGGTTTRGGANLHDFNLALLFPLAATFADFANSNVSISYSGFSGHLTGNSGIFTGDTVVFNKVGSSTPPTGLVDGTTYYAVVPDITVNVIQLAASLADATHNPAILVTFSNAGTGTFTLTANADTHQVTNSGNYPANVSTFTTYASLFLVPSPNTNNLGVRIGFQDGVMTNAGMSIQWGTTGHYSAFNTAHMPMILGTATGLNVATGQPQNFPMIVDFVRVYALPAAALTSPTATPTSSTAATLTVSTNVPNGTLYWIVSNNSTPPSIAQIKAGKESTGVSAVKSGSAAVSATGVQTINVTGLTTLHTYTAFFVQQALQETSNVPTGAGFTMP